jgi:hypothetical protein
MLNGLARTLLTSTALAPVGFTYAWVSATAGELPLALLLLAVSATLVALCIWLLRYAQTHLERVDFQPTTIEAADRENVGLLLLYLLPLFGSHVETVNWLVWVPAIVVFALVVATGYGYHFNPLLGIMGWHFYKVGTAEGVTYVVITRKQLRAAKTRLIVGQLTEYIVLDLQDEN